jgi:hypothetical protein
MNIFEGINIELKADAPSKIELNIPIEYEIVTFLKKEEREKEEKVELRVTLLDPESRQLGSSIIIPVLMQKNRNNHRQIIKGLGIKISSEGEYNFQVQLRQKGKEFETVSSLPFEVRLLKQVSKAK